MSLVLEAKYYRRLLSSFATQRKATISFVMFVRLSTCMEQLGFHWTDFNEVFYLRIVRKSMEKIVLIKN